MSKIVIFGAGGRAGRQAIAEAHRRGHDVTAVVRDPSRHADLPAVAGDVTNAADIAALAAGHDAAINAAAVYGEGTDPEAFFTGSARALISGLSQAGVERLVTVGLSALLTGTDGIPLLDTIPAEFRPFCTAHAAGLAVLAAEGEALDWVYISPAGDFAGERTGRYEIREHGDLAVKTSYADLAVALLDEIEAPQHHRIHLAVA